MTGVFDNCGNNYAMLKDISGEYFCKSSTVPTTLQASTSDKCLEQLCSIIGQTI